MTKALIGVERYLLDTNIFNNAKDNYYNPEINPAFWQWILEGNQQGCFYSIDKISDELKNSKEEDYLYQFAFEHSEIFLPSKTSGCIDEYAKLQFWANTAWTIGKNSNKLAKLQKSLHLKQMQTRFWLLMQKQTISL